jgi:bifunctional DNA-binding transcriptional regulator/antitoxin component of YhaV-PrlF toxin-antitoxin module
MSDMIAKSPGKHIRIGKRGTIVIPAQMRHEMAVDEGDSLFVWLDDAGDFHAKSVPTDPLERLRAAFGDAWKGVDALAYIRAMRDEDSD